MRDKYCAYYTDEKTITKIMVDSLHLKPEDIVIEPAAGQGAFVEEIIKSGEFKELHLIDINHDAVSYLRGHYGQRKDVEIRCTDTLTDEKLNVFIGKANKIIGNPPFGAWQSLDKREKLKRLFPKQYVKETYSLFLSRCVDFLAPGGRLCFILPDTYLYLNRHLRLRQKILDQCLVETILIFPSRLFPNVRFGYANLSILVLEKKKNETLPEHKISVFSGFRDTQQLQDWSQKRNVADVSVNAFFQSQVQSDPNLRLLPLTYAPKNGTKGLDGTIFKDVAYIVTGLYTGDNLQFLRTTESGPRSSKYKKLKPQFLSQSTLIEGCNEEKGFVPLIKGSSLGTYLSKDPTWFVRWDKKSIEFYKTNSRSRFQNSQWYFKRGIGLPMVKSKKIRAALMEKTVFDQSIVGVFPKDKKFEKYLLALLNSELINDMIHQINPSANNSANYIGQIPFVEPTEEQLTEINHLIDKILKNTSLEKGSESEIQVLEKKIETIYSGLNKR